MYAGIDVCGRKIPRLRRGGRTQRSPARRLSLQVMLEPFNRITLLPIRWPVRRR